MRQRNRLLLPLAIVLIGVFTSYRYWTLFGWPYFPLAAVYLTPAFALLIITSLQNRQPNRWWGSVHSIVALLSLLALGFFLLYDAWPITEPRCYTRIIGRYQAANDPVSADFPRTIPLSASQTSFTYLPSMQGCYMQMQYRDAPEVIAALFRHYDAIKGFAYTGGQDPGDGLPATAFLNASRQWCKLPNDYVIMVLKPYATGAIANRSPRHGVAISRRRQTIIYWYDSFH